MNYQSRKGGCAMKKKTAKNVLYYVVLAVLVAVFCFSAYKIYSY